MRYSGNQRYEFHIAVTYVLGSTLVFLVHAETGTNQGITYR